MTAPSRTRAPARIQSWLRHAHALPVVAVLLGACQSTNLGVPPPEDRMFFPAGLLLDPRAAADQPAKYLFVVNSNNDLSYNAGTVLAIDLDAFFAAWSLREPVLDMDGNPVLDDAGRPVMQPSYVVDPYCEVGGRCVHDVGSSVDAAEPCRRLALLPQVVECDERPFVATAHTVRTGDFATVLAASCEQDSTTRGCPRSRLWLPVRGDPSVTYIDLAGSPEDAPELECGQANDDDGRCDEAHRLRYRRNDDELTEIDREPFNMLISPTQRYGYVAHSDGTNMTLVALDGIEGGDGRPAIVDQSGAFASSLALPGGLGIAERPCIPDAAPSITENCTRPLVYASYRYARLLVRFTVQGVVPEPPRVCAGPQDEDEPNAIVCDPRVRSQQAIFPGGLDPGNSGFAPILGDIAFADESGDELLVVQTNPGALLMLDTSIGTDGEVVDNPSRPPLELCDQPTRMELYEEAGQHYALVSCYRAAQVFVVDLDAFRVVKAIVVGTGPFELEVDRARRLLYVSNNLESSITVVDLAADRPTRFNEIARIGLQEPFSR